ALVLWAGVGLAEEIKGTVKSVDPEKRTITLTVGDKEKTFTVAKDAEIVNVTKGKKKQPAAKEATPGGLGGIMSLTDVTLTTAQKDGKEVVTSIQAEVQKKKKKKAN